jgi:hypothetical protein
MKAHFGNIFANLWYPLQSQNLVDSGGYQPMQCILCYMY